MIVLDASVILKWFFDERDRNIALTFLYNHANGNNRVAVPGLLYYEFANVLAMKTELSEEMISKAINNIFSLDLLAFSLEQTNFIEAIHLSRLYKVSVYDTSYVVLANSLGVPFITADEKLAQKMKDMPFVQTLSHF